VFIYKNQRALRRVTRGIEAQEEEKRHTIEVFEALEAHEAHELVLILGKRRRF
jgi:hypothetical protein